MIPSAINLHKASKTLTLTYPSGEEYHLPAELLRVHSPSAEVQGHDVDSNFAGSRKDAGARGPAQQDYELSRFAAYLVAMNGDPPKY